MITDARGGRVPVTVIDADTVLFDTGAGLDYKIAKIPSVRDEIAPSELKAFADGDSHRLSFNGGTSSRFRVYAAIGGTPKYELVLDECTETELSVSKRGCDGDTLTYAVCGITERGTETKRATVTFIV